jgi:asparagine synthase (glutamine-hydrolysing)
MCGIYGFVNVKGDNSFLLSKMESVQIHRGPDGSGSYIDESTALGMRRLSIIDIENGNQPFFSASKQIVVLCNGEIYNFKELRAELVSKGYIFHTESDIEVLPYLYEEYGINFIDKLNGMYAFVILDKIKNEFYIVRDRLGVKPLYYAITSESLYFASEMKSLLEIPVIEREIDTGAISTYLEKSYIPSPYTPFKGIKKLSSGSYLKWSNNESELIKYWNPKVNVNNDITEKECKTKIDEILVDSIKKQLISDVPLGSFLSGGVDSSVVTAISAMNSKNKFSSFHMRWNNIKGKIDESKFAKLLVDQYKLDNTTENISEVDILKLLPKLIWHLDEPFGDAAFIPTYILSKKAVQKVKVVLSGAGGDELFGGYPIYKKYSWLKSVVGKLLFNKAPRFYYYDLTKGITAKKWNKAFNWFEKDFAKPLYESIYKNNKNQDKLNAYMLGDINLYLQDDILALTDKMTSAVSLECRVPLLDHRLVEYSLTIPSDMKIKDGEMKSIFKKYSEKYVHKDVLYREKEGFGSPVWEWVNKNKKPHFDPMIENGFLKSHLKINTKFLNKFTNKEDLSSREIWMYWHLVILEIWLQIFVGKKSPEDIFK